MERRNIHICNIYVVKRQAVFMFILIKIEDVGVESVIFSLIFNEMCRVITMAKYIKAEIFFNICIFISYYGIIIKVVQVKCSLVISGLL